MMALWIALYLVFGALWVGTGLPEGSVNDLVSFVAFVVCVLVWPIIFLLWLGLRVFYIVAIVLLGRKK